MANIIAIAGSIREESSNARLARQLVRVANELGANASFIDLTDYPLPIYNGDLEEAGGLPEKAAELKQLLAAADGLIVVTPEYNGFMTPLLMNTIDWCTRSAAASVDLACFLDKPIFIASSSPGPGGGARSAAHLKMMLSGIGAYVSPFPLTLPSGFQAFDENGQFVDEAMTKRASSMIEKYLGMVEKLK